MLRSCDLFNIKACLTAFHLPTEVPHSLREFYKVASVMKFVQLDKKNRNGFVRIVPLPAIGVSPAAPFTIPIEINVFEASVSLGTSLRFSIPMAVSSSSILRPAPVFGSYPN